MLALRDRIAPPTLGLETPGEGLDLDYVPDSAKPLNIDGKPAIAISSSFGFGGHNAVLCSGGRYDLPLRRPSWAGRRLSILWRNEPAVSARKARSS